MSKYEGKGIQSLRKLVRERVPGVATYTQRMRLNECIEMLEAQDRGETPIVPKRVKDLYKAISDGGNGSKPDEETREGGEPTPVGAEGDDDEVSDEELAELIRQAKAQLGEDGDTEAQTSGSETSESEDSKEGDGETEVEAKAQEQEQPKQEEPVQQDVKQNVDMFYEMLKQMRSDIDSNTEAIAEHKTNHPSGGGGASEVKIKVADLPEVKLKSTHKEFPFLLQLVAAKVNVYLVGPAGSGKTQAAADVARTLFPNEKGKFDTISLCRQTSKGDLLGYKDAHGNYHESNLVRIFRNGGVFLFDEVDQATDSIMKLCNMAIGNKAISTPAGTFKAHPQFYVIAAANTFGTGADRMYCGANQLDASTLNRFYFLEWGYDEKLENAMCGVKGPDKETKCELKKVPTIAQWLQVVRVSRANIVKGRMRMVVSPRSALNGVHAIQAGANLQQLLDGFIYQGATEDKKLQIYNPATAGNPF